MSEDTIYREDAIDALGHCQTYLFGPRDDDKKISLEVAECVIEQLSSAEPDDAALHESCTDCPLYDHDRHRCPRFNKVIPTTIQEILDTQTQRWIPVAERLPEDDTEVIVSCTDDSGDSEFSYTTTGWHFKGLWVVGNERSYFVRAWMPLPEPYREEEKHDR